jgi:hypothetical protein
MNISAQASNPGSAGPAESVIFRLRSGAGSQDNILDLTPVALRLPLSGNDPYQGNDPN